PIDRSRLPSDSRIPASSSTMTTVGFASVRLSAFAIGSAQLRCRRMHPSRILRKRLAFDQGIITPLLTVIYSSIGAMMPELLRAHNLKSITEKFRVPKTKALIAVVDDDESLREALTGLLRSLGFAVKAFPSAVDFLASPTIGTTSCLIADIHMP